MRRRSTTKHHEDCIESLRAYLNTLTILGIEAVNTDLPNLTVDSIVQAANHAMEELETLERSLRTLRTEVPHAR